ncbi:MAG TPA: hypothetical protein PKW35_05920 [Nannocystaceae bacterium]|nr:hypothetical protein [Nannocystaceae bacterium]
MPIAHHIAAALLLLAPPRPQTCGDEVAQELRQRRLKDAAARGERCWNVEDDPRALDLAIQARTLLGHGAHAAHDLRLYARHPRALDSSQRLHAEHIRPLIVRLTLTLADDDLEPDALRLRAIFLDDRERGALQLRLTDLTAYDRSWELELDPGRWTVELLDGDHSLLSTQEFTAADGLTVTLSRPKPPPEPSRDECPTPGSCTSPSPPPGQPRRRGVAVGLTITAAAAFATGAALLTTESRRTSWYNTEFAETGLARSLYLWDGSALVGAGIGGAAVAVTEFARAPDTAYYAELGAGGALGLGGLLWSAIHMTSYRRDTQARHDAGETTLPRSYFDSHFRQEIASGLLLGLGTGLATGAAVALITRAVAKRRQHRGARLTAWRRP